MALDATTGFERPKRAPYKIQKFSRGMVSIVLMILISNVPVIPLLISLYLLFGLTVISNRPKPQTLLTNSTNALQNQPSQTILKS